MALHLFPPLRRVLATDGRDRVIVVDGGGYRIEVDRLAVDVGRFGELIARADTAGPAFAGRGLAGADTRRGRLPSIGPP